MARKLLQLIQERLSDAEFGKNLAGVSNQFAESANRGFQFHERRQLFSRAHNETFSVAAIRVSQRFLLRINSRASSFAIEYRFDLRLDSGQRCVAGFGRCSDCSSPNYLSGLRS